MIYAKWMKTTHVGHPITNGAYEGKADSNAKVQYVVLSNEMLRGIFHAFEELGRCSQLFA